MRRIVKVRRVPNKYTSKAYREYRAAYASYALPYLLSNMLNAQMARPGFMRRLCRVLRRHLTSSLF